MSFALGFYEIFSYAIPGFLYILVVNGMLQLLKLPHMDLGTLSGNFGSVILLAVLSYLAGHIADPIAYRWYLLFNRHNEAQGIVEEIKAKMPALNIEFEVGDRRLLYSFIKHKNLALAEYLDKFNAVGVMLQNLSLGLFLFGLIQLAYIFITGQIMQYGLGTLLGVGFSFLTVKRSALYKGWYTRGIFEQALHYGTSLQMMFERERPEENAPVPVPAKTPVPPPIPVRKPRTRTKTNTKK